MERIIVLRLLLVALASLIELNVFADKLPAGLSNNVDQIVEDIQKGKPEAIASLRALSTNAISILSQYSEDSCMEVRYQVIRQLAAFNDTSTIPTLIQSLNDSEGIVRSRAIDGLHRFDPKTIAKLAPQTTVETLKDYISRWDEKSYIAITMLIPFEDASIRDFLRKTMDQAKLTRFEGQGGSKVLAPKMYVWALGALLGLGHEREDLGALLTSADIADRLLACEAVEISQRPEYAQELLPLFSDMRDAINIAPSHYEPHFLRVCDVAARTVINITGMKEAYPEHERRCSQNTLDEIFSVVANGSRIRGSGQTNNVLQGVTH